jgi:hypothetical protein
LKKLQKNDSNFDEVPLLTKAKQSTKLPRSSKKDLFQNMPFTKAYCFNKKTEPSVSHLFDKEIVNTAHRKDYIVNDFIPKIEAFEKRLVLIYAFPGCLTSGR